MTTRLADPPEKTVRNLWREHVPSEWKKQTHKLQRDCIRAFEQHGKAS
jgi:hypothetical protein